MAGAPLGDILQLRLKGTVNGQKTVTVQNFQVAFQSTINDRGAELADFLVAISPGGTLDIVTPYLATMPTNYTLDTIEGQWVWPQRLVVQTIFSGAPGVFAAASTAQNLHGTILLRTVKAGRSQVQSIKPPAAPSTAYTGGLITAGYRAVLATLGAALRSAAVGPIGAGVYDSGIWHKAIFPQTRFQNFDSVFTGVIQGEIRTQHRRTVGVGK